MTNESRAVLITLYKDYKDKRDKGISRDKAKVLEGYEILHSRLFSNIDIDTFLDILAELKKNDFLNIKYASNKPYIMIIENKLIEDFENLNFKKVLEALKFIKEVIPGF